MAARTPRQVRLAFHDPPRGAWLWMIALALLAPGCATKPKPLNVISSDIAPNSRSLPERLPPAERLTAYSEPNGSYGRAPVRDLGDVCAPDSLEFLRAPRANADATAHGLVSAFSNRIDSAENDRQASGAELPGPEPELMWWDEEVQRPLLTDRRALPIQLSSLSDSALRYSSFVHSLAGDPRIRQCELVLQSAKFDWTSYLESTYRDVNEPIGSRLTTGNNANRFLDKNWAFDAGVRRRSTRGGKVELFQRFGTQRNNSTFLNPNPQRTTRLELQLTQPLLKGAGRAYNESQIVLAQIRADETSDEVFGEIETHLTRVAEAYWGLYRARAELLQRHKSLDGAIEILENLESRRDVDALERQILRARAAVSARRSEMVRAETAIRNLESQLRLLVNDPELLGAGGYEFAPHDMPLWQELPLDKSEALHTALLNRPDVSQAIREVRAAALELNVAEKDVLPKLDLIASTYVAGLADDADFGQAFGDQFSEGRPSYAVGLQFEVPLGNRAARAEARRRELKWTQAMSRYRLAVEEGLTNVEISHREVETSYRELLGKRESLRAMEREAEYLSDRWRVLPDTGDSAAQLLEDLLDAQGRVTNEESAVVRAQVEYVLSIIRLKHEMGTLLRVCDPATDGQNAAAEAAPPSRPPE